MDPVVKPVLHPVHTISVVDTEEKCTQAIEQIMSDCTEYYHILGMFCEWNHQSDNRDPGPKIGKVLIVSVCTYRGYCALFRMDKFAEVPKSLKNENIGKTGVHTVIVARLLSSEYGIRLKRYADLVEVTMKDKPFSNPISKEIRKLIMDRNESDFDHRKWLDNELASECSALAAKHAYSCLEIQNRLDPNFFLTDLTSLGF